MLARSIHKQLSGKPAAAQRPAASPGAFAIEQIDLSEFRNYANLRLTVGDSAGAGVRPVVLTGANGAGKTNLLEAISFLAPGRGLRHARLSEITRQGQSQWAIAARLAMPGEGGGPLCVGTGLIADAEGERRAILIDGVQQTGSGALSERFDVLWLTPQMDRLLADGAGPRRRFLDRLVFGCDPAHARRVNGFERAMRDRNRLLAGEGADPAWLDALEEQMASLAAAIAATRLEAAARLNGVLAQETNAFPKAHLIVRGWLEDRLAESPALAVEEAYRGELARARPRDAAAGATLDGPHRSDLQVFGAMPGVEAAELGPAADRLSTGEQKALLIGMILAQTRLVAGARGAYPILLLDEVAAHLDPARRAALFAMVQDMGAQVWLTGTEPALFKPLAGGAEFIAITSGRVAPRGLRSHANAD